MRRSSLAILFVISVLSLAVRCTHPTRVIWQHRYDSGQEDFGNSVAVDGNEVIVGGTWRDTTFEPIPVDWQLLRYDGQGNLLWRRIYDRSNPDWLSAVGVDSDHDIVAVGYTKAGTAGDSLDLLLVKFSAQGDMKWDREYGFGLLTQGTALDLDRGGRITVCGSVFTGGQAQGPAQVGGQAQGPAPTATDDVFFARFDSLGNLLGRETLDFGANETGQDVGRDRMGNFIIVGEQTPLSGQADSGATRDILVAKLDTSGRVLWRRVYNSGEEDVRASVVASRTGHIFVCVTSASDTATHTHLLEYSPDGGLLGDRAFSGASNASCVALAIDTIDAILGVGAAGPDGAQHYLGWRYLREKFSVFLSARDYSHGLNDLANDIAIDSAGNAVITGVSDPGTDADIVTLKLRPVSSKQ